MTPYRSILFVPAHKPAWVERAVASGADAIVLDLEDSVPHAGKAEARVTAAESITHLATSDSATAVYVRPNGLDTKLTGIDLDAVVVPGLTGLFVPKVRRPSDLVRYDTLIDHFAAVAGVDGLDLIVPVETAEGIVACEEIARASDRLYGLVGPTAVHADIARAVGFRWTPEGTETLYLRSRVLVACRAAGIHPVTALWEHVHDLDGLRAFARQGRQLGFTGQVVIHPSHVPVVNDVFGPDEGELEFLAGLVAAFEDAERRGDAAVTYQGQHVDQAHADLARERLALAGRART
jgi:citrate lyase subunit beta/citryl-CoA lyase